MSQITTEFPVTETRVHHATKAKAVRLAEQFAAEYPALSLHLVDEDDAVSFRVEHVDADEPILESQKVPGLDEVQEACEEAGVDMEAEGEEETEERVSASVVPEIYRQRYREVSTTGTTCGDWLAEWITAETVVDDKLNVDELEALFSANGLDMTAKWAQLRFTGAKGWQGRYRMNGRQLLEKAIALSGKLVDARGGDVEIPANVVTDLQTKHAKWLAKERKAIAAAEEAARSSVEGEGSDEQVEESTEA